MLKTLKRAIQINSLFPFANTRKSIAYLNTNFQTMELWFQWIILKNILDNQIDALKKSSHCSKKEATITIWTMFLDINFNQAQTFLLQDVLDFIVSMRDEELPLYVLHLHIAQAIHEGKTEQEAIAEYRLFLLQDPENAIFENYAITQDFRVIPASEYRASQE